MATLVEGLAGYPFAIYSRVFFIAGALEIMPPQRAAPISGIATPFVPILFGLEDFIEIGAFGRSGTKRCDLLRGNIEVAVNASFAAIDDGESSSLVVVGHSGDDA